MSENLPSNINPMLIMRACYPGWYSRYPDCAVGYSYLASSGKMRWNSDTMTDAAVYQNMSAHEIAAFLFPQAR